MSEVTSKKLSVYRHHKPSGQARVRWQGREIYLGRFESPESRQRYAELLTKIVTGTMQDVDLVPRRRAKAVGSADAGLSVNELCVAFLRYAEQHYRKGDRPTAEYDRPTAEYDRPTAEYDCFLSAIKPLKELFGVIPVDAFGPCSLKAVRQKMVERGWCRKYVNKSANRLRHIFRWGVENELVEPTTLQKLQAVAPLLAGRTEAPNARRSVTDCENRSRSWSTKMRRVTPSKCKPGSSWSSGRTSASCSTTPPWKNSG